MTLFRKDPESVYLDLSDHWCLKADEYLLQLNATSVAKMENGKRKSEIKRAIKDLRWQLTSALYEHVLAEYTRQSSLLKPRSRTRR